MPRTSCRLRRLACLALTACTIGATVPSLASAATPCSGGDSAPATLSPAGLKATTLCLLNEQRAAYRLRPLHADTRLSAAAHGHSRDMVAHRYFEHNSRSGGRFSARIARTGWMRSHNGWTVGENLGWGTEILATPNSIVTAWMHSPPHRRNILDPRFRSIGIGIVLGIPVTNPGTGATYTSDFGS